MQQMTVMEALELAKGRLENILVPVKLYHVIGAPIEEVAGLLSDIERALTEKNEQESEANNEPI